MTSFTRTLVQRALFFSGISRSRLSHAACELASEEITWFGHIYEFGNSAAESMEKVPNYSTLNWGFHSGSA